jgi:tRNA(Ile)-lysidine synthase
LSATVLLSCILTAHTADDRAETLLQRLLVGGGSGSLSSIPARNGCVVRPLLNCTKEELRRWLVAQNVCIDGYLWREDATNLDTAYSRAFVRHELMPLLTKRNPRIVEGLNRTADLLADESAWLDEQAARLLPLSKDSFAAPLPLLRRAIYLACNQAIDELACEARITFEHVNLIAREGARTGFACQIPGGIEVRNVRGSLQFKKAKPPRHDPRNH